MFVIADDGDPRPGPSPSLMRSEVGALLIMVL